MELENFKFNKKFGQNFIFDLNLLAAIVDDSGITKSDDVLEIGPGAGTLTKMIAKKCNKVVSYEIDNNLSDILKENLKDETNSKVIFKDALKTDIKEIESNFDNNYSIIANLPYYITTPLIFKFLEETEKVDSITIMVQKEVANRLVAKHSNKDYGVVTILLDFYGNAKITRQVSRTMFTPMPNVDSAVVKIDIQKGKYNVDKLMFTKIVKCSFAMRRKTLVNNLSSGLNLSKDTVCKMLNDLNININIRAEQLTTMQYVDLTNKYLDTIRQN